MGGAASFMADGSSNWVLNPSDIVINEILTEYTDPDPLPSNVNPTEYGCLTLLRLYCVSHDFIGYVDNYEDEIYSIMQNAYSTMVQP